MGPTLRSIQPPASVPTPVPRLTQSQFTGSDSPKGWESLQQQDFGIFHGGKHLGYSKSLDQVLTQGMVLLGMALQEKVAGNPQTPTLPSPQSPS